MANNLGRISRSPLTKHPLEFLFGTWRGHGKGEFAGIDDFTYNEEITIYPDEAKRGWLYYRQKTTNPAKNNANFHSEVGYIRMPGMKDKVELVLAQPTGIASVEEGKLEGTSVYLQSKGIVRTASAKAPHVTEYSRTWTVDSQNEEMTYVFKMATEKKEEDKDKDKPMMAHHLSATLKRISKDPINE